MRIKQLDAFLAIIRTGTVTGAAELLNTSQPNVTKTIKQLEHALGMVLFERVGRGLRPTPEAELLHEMGEHIRDEFAEFERRARSLSDMKSGYLRIATQPTYSNAVLPAALKQFRAHYPDIHIRIDVLGRDNIFKLDGQLSIDLALVHFMGETPPPYVSRTIAQHPMVCLVPDGHPLHRRAAVSVAEAITHPRIGFPSDHISTKLVGQCIEPGHANLVPDIIVNYSSLACDLVREGLGVAIVEPISFEGAELDGVSIVPLQEELMFKTGISHPSRKAVSLPAKRLIEIILSIVATMEPRQDRRVSSLSMTAKYN